MWNKILRVKLYKEPNLVKTKFVKLHQHMLTRKE